MNNKKAFTLVELLAVIVILGLLMAITIPSITRYIIQSRKKSYISNVKGYINAVSTAVNDMEYTFTDPEATYYLSIDCIDVERGGKSPFGEWIDAYVVVGYNEINSSYDYYWFGQDRGGYTVDLVKENKLDIKLINVSNEQMYKRELNNKNGSIYQLNKENSCSIEKIVNEIPEDKLPMLKAGALPLNGYDKTKIKNITFENKINIPEGIQAWDVTSTTNGKVMAYVVPNAEDANYFDLYVQGEDRIYANPNSSSLFSGFEYVDSINNINLLNTSRVTNMAGMFQNTGRLSKTFVLNLDDNFDTSNVTNMRWMFAYAGYSNVAFTLDLGNNFDTSKVVNMECMFYHTGQLSKILTLDLGDKFNTINVSNMSQMFNSLGYSSRVFDLDLGEQFYTNKISRTYFMFAFVGRSNPNFTLDLGDHFDTSKVKDMAAMFAHIGASNPNFVLDLGDKFNISSATNMSGMFGNITSKELRLNVSSFNSNVNLSSIFSNSKISTVYVKTEEDKTLLEANVPSNVIVIVG